MSYPPAVTAADHSHGIDTDSFHRSEIFIPVIGKPILVGQNFGAKAHDIFISPKNKSALFWGEYDGKKPIMSKGHTVHIPALPGKHFVEQSFEELQEFTPGFLMRAIEEVQG